jgi:hypothetical protein
MEKKMNIRNFYILLQMRIRGDNLHQMDILYIKPLQKDVLVNDGLIFNSR